MIQDDSLFFYLFQMGTKEPITRTHESRGRGYVKPVCKQFLPQPSSHTPSPLVPTSTPIRGLQDLLHQRTLNQFFDLQPNWKNSDENYFK